MSSIAFVSCLFALLTLLVPTEYIEELYRELDAIEPLKAMGVQAMTVEATRKLKDKISLSLRYHE